MEANLKYMKTYFFACHIFNLTKAIIVYFPLKFNMISTSWDNSKWSYMIHLLTIYQAENCSTILKFRAIATDLYVSWCKMYFCVAISILKRLWKWHFWIHKAILHITLILQFFRFTKFTKALLQDRNHFYYSLLFIIQ